MSNEETSLIPDATAHVDTGVEKSENPLSDAGAADASADHDAAEIGEADVSRGPAVDSPDEPQFADATVDDSDAAPPQILPSVAAPGDLLITEIMFAPWGPEPQSEWFEIYNRSTDRKLLNGLTIQDGYPRAHVISAESPVVVPSQTYVLLVRDRAIAEANVVPADAIAYEYGAGLGPGEGIQLENDASGALSLWDGNTLLANVPYGPWGLASYGQSIELDALQFEGSDSAASWCLAENPWAAGSDDGTPGADNDCP